MNNTKNILPDILTSKSYMTTDKILDILEKLGYMSERKPSYENELRDLIAIEIRRNSEQLSRLFETDSKPQVESEKSE